MQAAHTATVATWSNHGTIAGRDNSHRSWQDSTLWCASAPEDASFVTADRAIGDTPVALIWVQVRPRVSRRRQAFVFTTPPGRPCWDEARLRSYARLMSSTTALRARWKPLADDAEPEGDGFVCLWCTPGGQVRLPPARWRYGGLRIIEARSGSTELTRQASNPDTHRLNVGLSLHSVIAAPSRLSNAERGASCVTST